MLKYKQISHSVTVIITQIKGRWKLESTIFCLLNKEVINALQTWKDEKIEAIRKEIISGSKIVKRNVSVQNLTGEQTDQPMKPFWVNNECLISTWNKSVCSIGKI